MLNVFFYVYVFFQLLYVLFALFVRRNKVSDVTSDELFISVLIPCYNEEKILAQCISGWSRISYSNKEALLINDGSTDNTMETLNDLLQLQLVQSPNFYKSLLMPNIFVIDQQNGGKSDALNNGLRFAKGEIIVTLDADSILKSDSLHHMNAVFTDEHVVAAGGAVHVGQCLKDGERISYLKNPLLRFQLSGYLASFYVRKVTQAKLNALSVVSGAFGAFRRSALISIGGFMPTLGEDMEITFRLHKWIKKRRREEKLAFVPQAVCYTEVPESMRDLFYQRIRWQQGFVDCVIRYLCDFFRLLPVRFSVVLVVESVLISSVGVAALFLLPLYFVTGYFSFYSLLFILIAWSSEFIIRIIGNIRAHRSGYHYSLWTWIKVVTFTIIESVSYRLLDTFFFVIGTIYYIFGSNSRWNKLARKGIN